MAQTVQIVPKYSFPYVETHINDNSFVDDNDNGNTDTVRFVYPVYCGKGIDNTFVKRSSRASAVSIFGESDFNKYGQPYMQALACVDRNNCDVWFMRVMPENATYANAIVNAWYKVDSADEYEDAHKRRFRIKFTTRNVENAVTPDDIAKEFPNLEGTPINGVYRDAEGYIQKPLMTIRSSGRGKYGNNQSVRLSQNTSYEKEYGIKMYNYEILENEAGLNLIATYVGANVTSNRYADAVPTLIDDVIARYSTGTYPVVVSVNEDNVAAIYEAYIEFAKALHTDLTAEYEAKAAAYNIPEEIFNGVEAATEEQAAQIIELNTIEAMETATSDAYLPDLDEFDLIFGRNVGSSEGYPGIAYPTFLDDTIDITAEDYDANNYTSSTGLVDFGSTVGVKLLNGSEGYFENPRTEVVNAATGRTVQWTVEDEINECYRNAFNAVYDKRILSPHRIEVTAFWDANYDFTVKEAMVSLAQARYDCRVYLDANFVDSFSEAAMTALEEKFAQFDDMMVSIDTQSYYIREPNTKKKVRVTISYFLAPRFVDHLTLYGEHIPFVKDYATLTGHVKDSITPCVEEYEVDVMERLYNSRFNYFTCIAENTFRRSTQNTRQIADSDLLEESNVNILFHLKRLIEKDADSQIYNFAEEGIRQTFCEVEKTKYASWEGTRIESFDINFAVTEYEFNHSILHLYVGIVFRGLTKRVLVEININKRSYSESVDDLV